MADNLVSRGISVDQTFNNVFSRGRAVVPAVSLSTVSPVPDAQLVLGRIGVNKNLYYSSDLAWHRVKEYDNKLIITHGDNNFQLIGVGALGKPPGDPSLIYFGTQLGPIIGTNPPSLMPFQNTYNLSGFIENIIFSAGGPNYSQGAPGWQVPVAGLYKVSAKCMTGGSCDKINNPAGPSQVGIGSSLDGTLSVGINNGGVPIVTLASTFTSWSNPTLPVEDNISYSVSGFTFLQLLTTDVLFVAFSTINRNTAISVSNGSMEIEYISP